MNDFLYEGDDMFWMHYGVKVPVIKEGKIITPFWKKLTKAERCQISRRGYRDTIRLYRLWFKDQWAIKLGGQRFRHPNIIKFIETGDTF